MLFSVWDTETMMCSAPVPEVQPRRDNWIIFEQEQGNRWIFPQSTCREKILTLFAYTLIC